MIDIDYRELASYAPLLLVLIAFITLTITLVRLFAKRRAIKNKYYSTIWKKSSKLNPKELIGIRPFNDFYYKREADERIVDILNEERNLLITGPPLSGKTRALYQALKSTKKPFNVIIPRCIDVEIESFLLPWSAKFKRKKIMIIDDLHRFVEQYNFDHLLNYAIVNNLVIAATCQSSGEFKKVKKILLDKGIYLESVFKEQPIVLQKIHESEAKKIAQKSNKDWGDIKFNGTIGSIYMKLAEIEKRLNHQCSDEEKLLLKAIKKLNIGGLYIEHNNYFIDHIKILIKQDGLNTKKYQFESLVKSLKDKELIEGRNKETVQVEEVYLHEIVQFDAKVDELEVLKELFNTFNEEPKVMHRIGSIALMNSKHRRNSIEYLELSKASFLKALNNWSEEKFPGNYAMTHNSLGIVYADLARLKDPSYFKDAIFSFHKSNKITSAQKNIDYYSLTSLNLGCAYAGLAKIEEKELNNVRAINFYQESLNHFTVEKFPYEYATVMHNTAASYCALATIKDLRDNCEKAIDACNKALSVRTIEKFPIEYAATHHNLALAYYYLAKDKNLDRSKRIDYCEKGIEACNTALNERDPNKYPSKFAATQQLQGSIHGRLITIYQTDEDKKRSGILAIKAIKKAMKILDLDSFPLDHARAQKSLGVVYLSMAHNVDKTDNCKKAIDAFEQALNVFTESDFPELYLEVNTNLERARKLCRRN